MRWTIGGELIVLVNVQGRSEGAYIQVSHDANHTHKSEQAPQIDHANVIGVACCSLSSAQCKPSFTQQKSQKALSSSRRDCRVSSNQAPRTDTRYRTSPVSCCSPPYPSRGRLSARRRPRSISRSPYKEAAYRTRRRPCGWPRSRDRPRPIACLQPSPPRLCLQPGLRPCPSRPRPPPRPHSARSVSTSECVFVPVSISMSAAPSSRA
ncbi:hypothetical protein LXA43DRAFT_74897 [Ganoderma leucocontextum]|nr:hypothetical protein LXA43DRAFT_74897 [Ganoderma leucocontextum]